MQILTTSGYQNPLALVNGTSVLAFRRSGRRIVNKIESIDFVDYAEWRRWWQQYDRMPAFNWVRINGQHELFCEQSIWRNGKNVCHARDIVVGDEIYDDEDDAVRVESVEIFEDRERVWYRFDISGDHSYIVDGLTVHNASRFWVGGTGTWDGSSTTHWASSSGGSSGASVPGSADAVTLNGSSGGGTVTVNTTVTVQSITMDSFAWTLDFATNNNNVTLSLSGIAFSAAGSATQTLNMGNGTWTLSGTNSGGILWSAAGSGLTFNANSSTLVFSGVSSTGTNQLQLNKTYNNISFTGVGNYQDTFVGLPAVSGTLLLGPGVSFRPRSGMSVANLASTATLSAPALLSSGTIGTSATIAGNGTFSVANIVLKDVAFSGGNSRSATSSFDMGNNSGITITPPSGGGQRFSATIF